MQNIDSTTSTLFATLFEVAPNGAEVWHVQTKVPARVVRRHAPSPLPTPGYFAASDDRAVRVLRDAAGEVRYFDTVADALDALAAAGHR